MRTLRRLSVTLFLLVGPMGCGEGNGAPTDAGVVLPDGLALDAGDHEDAAAVFDVGTDAGDGTCGTMLAITGWGELPATCVPRCSADTFAAFSACSPTDDACLRAALAGDTTPTVLVSTYAGPLEVSCAGGGGVYGCITWQHYSCESDACPAQYDAWASCAAARTCTNELDVLHACITASATYQGCMGERGRACFP